MTALIELVVHHQISNLNCQKHCYIHEVTLPNSWYSIQSGLNNILYFYSSPLAPDEDNTNVHYLALQLDEGVYTGTELATELKAKINGVVGNTNFSNTYEFFYSVKTNKITIFQTMPIESSLY